MSVILLDYAVCSTKVQFCMLYSIIALKYHEKYLILIVKILNLRRFLKLTHRKNISNVTQP